MSDRANQSRLTPQDRQDQIIAIATEEISQFGFWGFSVRRVAERLGLTGPAVLYHFKTKVGLMIAVLEHRDEVDMRNTAAVLGVPYEHVWDEPIAFGLKEFCHAVVSRNAQQMEMVRLYTILQAEALNEDHPAYEYYQKRERRTLTNFTKVARHENVADPRREAVDVLSAMEGIQVRWLHDPENIDLVTEWNSFADGRWGL